jgi:hypothetical protein
MGGNGDDPLGEGASLVGEADAERTTVGTRALPYNELLALQGYEQSR